MAKGGVPSNRQLTAHLRRLAAEIPPVEDMQVNTDGAPMTRAEQLATELWKRAIGYTEIKEKSGGKTAERVSHDPQQWAMVLVFERLEGKAPIAVEDKVASATAAEMVTEQAQQRINNFTDKTVGATSGPPRIQGGRNADADDSA